MTNPKQIIERLASKKLCNLHPIQEPLCSVCNYISHPVYKMHVEEFLINNGHPCTCSNDWLANEECVCDGVENKLDKLKKLWIPCRLTSSLQQIEEESGYGCDCVLKYENWEKTCICKDTVTKKLKSPQARALFEFLDHITK